VNHFLYEPKYIITDEILILVRQIVAKVDVLSVQSNMEANSKSGKANRISSIHSSLAIENNSLSLKQVTTIIEGKLVLGPPQDICEVENAILAYSKLFDFNPFDIKDLFSAHKILMKNLVKTPGQFRSGNVGVVRGNEIIHMAPPIDKVFELMEDLLNWVKVAAVNPLVKSCVFHYEFEFIHPFSDGNGRMGRMWQMLLLYNWKEIFAYLPVECLVYKRQDDYYAALRQSNKSGDCTKFVHFMLQAIWDTLNSCLK
jgi:Fic family protein